MSQESWTQNPALSGIDPAKLQMLLSLAGQAQGKNQTELLSFLMSAASQGQENNLSFQPSEADAIINVLKMGKSPQEIQRIDRICAIMKQMRGGNPNINQSSCGPNSGMNQNSGERANTNASQNSDTHTNPSESQNFGNNVNTNISQGFGRRLNQTTNQNRPMG